MGLGEGPEGVLEGGFEGGLRGGIQRELQRGLHTGLGRGLAVKLYSGKVWSRSGSVYSSNLILQSLTLF